MIVALDRRVVARVTYRVGLIGTLVMIFAMSVTALTYRGSLNEPYNLLNHFVSELGAVGISPLALIFNLSLIFSSICLGIFISGTAYFMRHWFRVPYGIVGMLLGLNGVLLGFFPINNLVAHFQAALPFFYLGFASILMFTINVLFFRTPDLPLWLAIPSGATSATYFTLIFLTEPVYFTYGLAWSAQPFVLNRPAFSTLALGEWVVMLCIFFWVTVVSLYLRAWLHQSRKIQ